MKKYKSFSPPLLVMLIIAGSFQYDARAQSKWSGSLTLTQRVVSEVGKSDRYVEVSFTNALPTLYRNDPTTDLDFTDDKGTGRANYRGEVIIGGKLIGTGDCRGSGQTELNEVLIDPTDSSYRIHAIGPACNGTTVDLLPGGTTQPYGPEFTDIIVSSKALQGVNQNVLSGTETTVSDIGLGNKVTTTVSWNLVRSVDVVFMVTPIAKAPLTYDTWLPVPGRDETTKGSFMEINLKLQRRNGQPPSLKADEFELRLSNTSREPGITINFPLSPRANQLPDLRFLPHPGAESGQDDQLLTIPSANGVTGKAFIGSYDGGAYTTLTVYALLEGGIRIKGELLVPGGEQEILIPKRKPGSIIATAWLTANGNPADVFDEEESPGNTNNGDGLSAYEEYRGVVSMGQFRRLDPKKKELGILPKQSEIGIFSEGFTQFQNASGIKIILFNKYEIPENRRLNQNSSSAHIFKQFVLRINKGNTDQIDFSGQINRAWGLAFGAPDIPARVTHIVIDVDRILSYYQLQFRYTQGNLPYNGGDMVASTTAHEIGHGVNLPHHGIRLPNLPGLTVPADTVPHFRIFLERGTPEITSRPYPIHGPVGSPNNHESGNVSCFMCYRNKTNWVRIIVSNNELHYYKVPQLREGSLFCTDKRGTDINANNRYYGNAIQGCCLGRIKLKD